MIQVKYIGDKDWDNLKEKIHERLVWVKTHIVYLNFENDMDTIMDYMIDFVPGSPSRNKVVIGNVCMQVDDLFFFYRPQALPGHLYPATVAEECLSEDHQARFPSCRSPRPIHRNFS